MEKQIKESLKKINKWWGMADFRFKVIERKGYMEEFLKSKGKLIEILTGARRVGKTYILYSLINRFLGKRGRKKILYLTGEMREVEEYGLDKMLEVYLKMFDFDYESRLIILIDEVQEIKNWQKIIKFYYDQSNFKFYLTGSSSLILNEQTSKLTGRFLRHKIFPLDFGEWLKFSGKKLFKTDIKNKELVEEYLRQGGYPEYVLNQDEDYLRQAVTGTLYRDLLSYYGVRNPALLEELLKYLADKIGNPVSPYRIKLDLKVDEKTARFYLKYLEEVFMIYPVYKEGRSHRITKSSNPKYYFNDTGVLRLMSLNAKIGGLAENAVFLQLLRKSRWMDRPRLFYGEILDQEVDFVTEKAKIEVKYRTGLRDYDWRGLEKSGEKLTVIVPRLVDGVFGLRLMELWRFLVSDVGDSA